ncbi:hypothetical protein AAP_06404 [Ascosphaera apis ARSEF 7405]|uniref:DUF2961 domain-containing protein n=1 Tax=Ascosphaera apis ARSEF 7405 TaxID=392613 RepID=A0A167UTU4_9EURO|nr:hypothetical protein AAP_06404 [Ascosphaera apis ARSEF 7405]
MLDKELFTALTQRKAARAARVSSWDTTGYNNDNWVVMPGERVNICDIDGPGKITHMWFVQTCRRILGPGLCNYPELGCWMAESAGTSNLSYEDNDPDYYRKIVIRMYWDNSDTPSVCVPLGDFFCIGHSLTAEFTSMPFTVTCRPEDEKKFGGAAALNCWLPMPFNSHARIEIENQGEIPYVQYFYVDYELQKEQYPKDELLYFHAHWKRMNPTPGWAPPMMQTNSAETSVPNLDGRDETKNYVLLETEGAGTYIGCNHSVAHFQGSWWGEGDDMIWIDDDTWPPSLHGTGGEDYFCNGWGMQKKQNPFSGSILHEGDVPGYQVSYRWHIADPVRFQKRIKVTLEHGHANHLTDDWATTVYWYQTLPTPRKLEIPPVKERLPRRATIPPHDWKVDTPGPVAPLTDLQKKQIAERERRYKEILESSKKLWEQRGRETREREKLTKEYCADVYKRFHAQN